MKSDIILISPIGTGKSTVGTLLSEKIGIPQCSMDDLRWDYYKEIGYDEELEKYKRQTEGIWGVCQYWKPFEAYAVERLLLEHESCIIDFGAGHSVYDDAELFQRVDKVLSPYPNVFLLLPSPDLNESLEILNQRNEYVADGEPNINEYFLKHHSNYQLAKFTVYNKDKTPEETCTDILSLIDNLHGFQ